MKFDNKLTIYITMDKYYFINDAYRKLRSQRKVASKKDFAEMINYKYTNVINAMKHRDSKYLTDNMIFAVQYVLDEINNRIEEPQKRHDINETQIAIEDYILVDFKDLATTVGKLWDSFSAHDTSRKNHRRLVYRDFNDGNYIIIKIQGQSMDDGSKRSLVEGDELLIKQYLGNYENLPMHTKLFVLNTANGSFVRQILNYEKETGMLTYHSFNAMYPDFKISVSELLQLFTVEKKLASNILF